LVAAFLRGELLEDGRGLLVAERPHMRRKLRVALRCLAFERLGDRHQLGQRENRLLGIGFQQAHGRCLPNGYRTMPGRGKQGKPGTGRRRHPLWSARSTRDYPVTALPWVSAVLVRYRRRRLGIASLAVIRA